VLAALLLVAANLRTAVTSVGALLAEINHGLGLSPVVLGVITALPTVAFAAFGALTPRLSRRISSARLLLAAMFLLMLGQAVRALTAAPWVFLVASAAALAGVAAANILLPGLVKQYFPKRLGIVTGLYTTTMVVGGCVAAATSVPIAQAFGSWRAGIGIWGILAVVATVAALALRRRTPAAESVVANPPRVSRTRLGWALALFFGLQSFSAYALMGWLPQLYRDAGFSPRTAGILLAIVIGAGVPVAYLMPAWAARRPDQRPLVALLTVAMLVAYVGLALAPRPGVVLWTALLAFGQGSFPLALALIGLRARTSAATVALSGFTQSVGYLIAVAGPLLVGLFYDLTRTWYVSLGVLIVAMVGQLAAGLSAARPQLLPEKQVDTVIAG
jgi:CP family cyanate transporter-like MFS transporter